MFSVRALGSNSQLSSRGPQLAAHIRTSLDDGCLSNLSQSSQFSTRTFSCEDLQGSEVISQVDTKFIACVLRPGEGSERVLTLVDQHAADERVRVERYLKRLCTSFLQNKAEKHKLEYSSKVLLVRGEAEAIGQPGILSALSRWGLCIEAHLSDAQHGSTLESIQDSDFYQVDVTAVPDVVSRRVR